MTNETEHDPDFDALLREAGRERPAPDLVARVLDDAVSVQADAARAAATRPRDMGRPRPRFVSALGGWKGFGGVTAAGILGLAVGFWAPEAVGTLSGAAFGMVTSGADWTTPDLAELALENSDV